MYYLFIIIYSFGFRCVSRIVVWNIETKQAICGSAASPGMAGNCLTVQYSNTDDNVFVSAGRWATAVSKPTGNILLSLYSVCPYIFLCILVSGTLRVWELDRANCRIQPTECQTGRLKRIVKCVQVRGHGLIFTSVISAYLTSLTCSSPSGPCQISIAERR